MRKEFLGNFPGAPSAAAFFIEERARAMPLVYTDELEMPFALNMSKHTMGKNTSRPNAQHERTAAI